MSPEQNTTGSEAGGMGSTSQNNIGGAPGGHSVSQGGPATFTNMQIPGLTFPSTGYQIQQTLQTLPPEQQAEWGPAITQLSPDQTFNTLQELQTACQTTYQAAYENQAA